MEFDYTCTGLSDMEPAVWKGHIRFLSQTNPYELEVSARYSSFHIICGRHEYGNYICVPNWGIGTEIARLCDRFWNLERLTTYYPELSMVDAISIVDALVAISKYVSL
jgi:hypothetical protein